MIEWIWPWVFALAPVPLLMRLFVKPVERAQAALTVPDLANFQYDELSQSGREGNRIPWRAMLLWLIWLALVVAMARPQWTGEPVTLPISLGPEHAGTHSLTANTIDANGATAQSTFNFLVLERAPSISIRSSPPRSCTSGNSFAAPATITVPSVS